MARPMLDRWEMPGVEVIHVEEERRLVDHPVPGRTGSLLQDMGSRPARLVVAGSVYLEEDRTEFLQEMRRRYATAEPVTFVADITTASSVSYVVIRGLDVAASSDDPACYRYSVTLVESAPPRPGGLNVGGTAGAIAVVQQQIEATAAGSMSGLAGLESLATEAGLPEVTALLTDDGLAKSFEAVLGMVESMDGFNLSWGDLLQPLNGTQGEVEATVGSPEQGELKDALQPVADLNVTPPDAAKVAGGATAAADALSAAKAKAEAAPAPGAAALAGAVQGLPIPDPQFLTGGLVTAAARAAGHLNQADPAAVLAPVTGAVQSASARVAAQAGASLTGIFSRIEQAQRTLSSEPIQVALALAREIGVVARQLVDDPSARAAGAFDQLARDLTEQLQKGLPIEEYLAGTVTETVDGLLLPFSEAYQRAKHPLAAAFPEQELSAALAEVLGLYGVDGTALASRLQNLDWQDPAAVDALKADLAHAAQLTVLLADTVASGAAAVTAALGDGEISGLREPIIRVLNDAANAQAAGPDPTAGALPALLKQVSDAAAAIDPGKAAAELTALVQRARTDLESLHIHEGLQEMTDGLGRLGESAAAIDEARTRALLELQSLLQPVEGALTEAVRAVQALPQAADTALTAVNDGIATVSAGIEEFRQALQDALAEIGSAAAAGGQAVVDAAAQIKAELENLNQQAERLDPAALSEQVAQGLAPITDQLKELHVTGAVDLVLKGLGELEATIGRIDISNLSPVGRNMLGAAKALLIKEANDKFGPLKEQLISQFHDLRTRGPEAILNQADSLLSQVRAALDQLDPAAVVAPVQTLYNELAAALEPLRPGALLAPLSEAHAQATASLNRIDPQLLIDPLEALYVQLQGRIAALNAAGLIQQAQALQAQLQQTLDELHADQLHDRLTGALQQVAATIAALDPDQLLAPVRGAVAQAAGVIATLDPAQLFAGAAELNHLLAGAVAAIPADSLVRLQTLADEALKPVYDLPDEVASVIGQDLALLEGTMTAFGPGALAQQLRSAGWTALRQAAAAATVPDEFRTLVRACDPVALLSPVVPVHDQGLQTLRAVRAGWESGAAELRNLGLVARQAMLDAMPAWVTTRPLTPQVLTGQVGTAVTGFIGQLSQAYEPLRHFQTNMERQLDSLAAELRAAVGDLSLPPVDLQALCDAALAAFTALSSRLLGVFDLSDLAAELEDWKSRLTTLVAALDPDQIRAPLQASWQSVRAALEALSPAPIAAQLDAIYAKSVLAALAASNPATVVEPGLQAIAATLKQKFAAVTVRGLAAPITREIDRLGRETEEGLRQIGDRLQKLPRAIPIPLPDGS